MGGERKWQGASEVGKGEAEGDSIVSVLDTFSSCFTPLSYIRVLGLEAGKGKESKGRFLKADSCFYSVLVSPSQIEVGDSRAGLAWQ